MVESVRQFIRLTVVLTFYLTGATSWATEHWAFVRPRRASLPTIEQQNWPRGVIDHFVAARLQQADLRPSPAADRHTLIRRLTFDLTGLPPTRAEVQQFVYDNRPDAYNHLVDRLLASPRFGEHWAVPWLEAARYADTTGYQHDFYREVYPWRTWVIHALNDNMPFDQFITEQLAGDLLPHPTDEQILATCFVRLHRLNMEFGAIDEEFYVENVVDRIETVSTVMMGLTVGCARCHDHKFDPISMRDFYGLFAFLNNGHDLGTDPGGLHKFPYSKPILRYPDVDQRQQLAQLAARLQAIPPDNNIARDELLKEQESVRAAAPSVMIMQEREQRRPAFVLVRGSYSARGKQVPPATPAILPPLPNDVPRNRLGLAEWLTSAENPLLARVTVNRYWRRLFGIGLVKTIEDFGVQGEYPSHPQLLDWLAVEFSESGWNVKHILKTIVTSATYRQSSFAPSRLRSIDPENRLLARGPAKRLSAFEIRDQALAASDLLVEKIGGRPVKPYQPTGLWHEVSSQIADVVPEKILTDRYEAGSGDQLYRRSLYTFWKRSVPPPGMALLDAPNREVCAVRQSRTNTPLQALLMLNDTTFLECARHLAARMITSGSENDPDRLTHGIQLLLSREPQSGELATLSESLRYHRDHYERHPKEATNTLSHGASHAHDNVNPIELAAYTQVALLLLNLDEAVTLR